MVSVVVVVVVVVISSAAGSGRFCRRGYPRARRMRRIPSSLSEGGFGTAAAGGGAVSDTNRPRRGL